MTTVRLSPPAVPPGTPLLGEVITWTCPARAVRHADLIAALRDAFLAWKKAASASVVSLVIGAEPGDLAGISDEAHTVKSLTADCDPVGRALDL